MAALPEAGLVSLGTVTVAEYEEAMSRVTLYARQYAKTPLGRDDAIGEGNLAVAELAQRFDRERGGNFTAVASSYIKWRMTDAARACRGTKNHPDMEEPMDGEKLAHHAAPDHSSTTDIMRAVSNLSANDQRVVVLMMAGHSQVHIAEAAGVTEGRISQRLRRIRKELWRFQ